jgi:Raf kinase inhibitor-like YbhB/YbcL family protein
MSRTSFAFALVATLGVVAALAQGARDGEAAMTFRITSAAFEHEAAMPAKYTCEGEDTSPPLAWSGVPPGTKSLALVVDDPDAPDPRAPKITWVHWVVYAIDPGVSSLPEGASPAHMPPGAREGLNDWKAPGYRGPCPPVGRHRYFHKLYALDTQLGELAKADKASLERAMQGHVLAQASLVGIYAKKGGR